MGQNHPLPEHGDLVGYEPVDEGAHESGVSPLWHESFWIYWGDGRSRGGCVHVGQETNVGKAYIWATAYTEDAAFRRTREDYPLDRAALAAGRHTAGPYALSPKDGRTLVTVREQDCELDFSFDDQLAYPTLLPMFPQPADPTRNISGTHYQAPGRARGRLRLGGRDYDVDAFAQRGHSWGERDHKALRGQGSRWITGSFGEALNFSAYVAIRGDGSLVRSAFVVDGRRAAYTRDVDVVVEQDLDGVSWRGGTVTASMPDGRVYVFRCRFDNVNLFQHHGVELTVAGGRLSCDALQGGYCAWEIKDRPPSSPGRPPFSLRALVTDGLHPAGG
jgi:hypothetical protein